MRVKIIILSLFFLAINNICFSQDDHFLILGADLLKAGKIEEAISNFKKAEKNNEIDAAYSHYLLGTIYNLNGNYPEAIFEFKQALRLTPVLEYGIKTVLGEAYQEGLDYTDMQVYAKNLPKNLKSKVFFVLGTGMQRSKISWDKAINAYKTAIAFEPEFQFLRDHIIDKLYEYKEEIALAEDAIKEYEEIVEMCPSAQNYLALGKIYFKKDKEKATVFYNKAIGSNPNLPDAYYGIGLIFAGNGKYKEAVESLRKALELDSGNNRYHDALCLAYLASKDFESALGEYKIIRRKVTPPTRYNYEEYLREVILMSRYFGVDASKGAVDFKIELDDYPSQLSEEKRKALLSHFERANEYKRSASGYSKSIKEYKKSLGVYETAAANFGLAMVYEKMGEYENMTSHLERAKDISPDKAILWTSVSDVYFSYGKADKAIDTLKEFLEKHPRDALVLYELGTILFENKDWAEALQIYDRLKDVDSIIFGLVEENYKEAEKTLKSLH
ncbi:MAG: tetratricopeptide repeat protein [Candidatus Omnitrophica bacterium]|nr:tetratricopeptide repeat protein [Candidatus Omnitrophota bacterium]